MPPFPKPAVDYAYELAIPPRPDDGVVTDGSSSRRARVREHGKAQGWEGSGSHAAPSRRRPVKLKQEGAG